MDREANRKFIAKAESLVKPQDVTAISFLGDFNRIFPKSVQEKTMLKGSASIPYMGFIVDPYCFFLAYPIIDLERASSLLPEGYELAKTSVFEGQTPAPLVLIGAFSLRTSAFIGHRLEFYIIARKKDTGLMSWIIADYVTNTNSYDPKNCFSGYTADPAILTTTPYGELLADFAGKTGGKEFALSAEIEKGEWKNLTRELWVDGNLSIDYGGDLRVASSKPFSLIFDPYLMHKALHLDTRFIHIRVNSYLGDIIEADKPVCGALFPYSQHFVIRQDLPEGAIRNEADLNRHAQVFLDLEGFRTMTGDSIKKPLLRGLLASAFITWGIMIFLVIKVLSA